MPYRPYRLLLSSALLLSTAAVADPDATPGRTGPLAAPDAAGELFGFAVAAAPDAVAVGAPQAEGGAGAVYLYAAQRQGPGGSRSLGELVSPEPEADAAFGAAVAVDGDTLLAGAPHAGGTRGAAWLFARRPGAAGWAVAARLTPVHRTPGERFGFAVDLAGDTAVVGSDPLGGSGAGGAAYVFARRGGGWEEVARLAPDAPSPDDRFGFAVAAHEGWVAVGAHGDDRAGRGAGAVYLFRRAEADRWHQVTAVTADDAAPGDELGFAVDLEGDTLVAGARRADARGSDSGAAYIFERNQGGPDQWGQVAKLIASDSRPGDLLGFSVALGDGVALAGSPWHVHRGARHAVRTGTTYLFVRRGTSWVQLNEAFTTAAATDDRFGWAVALAGATGVVGVPFHHGAGRDAGGVHLLDLAALAPGACFAGPHTLCLHGGRFRVEVEWEDFDGRTGAGTLLPGSSAAAGVFWFFSPDNWELLVKVLDACAGNRHYWVFAAATTTVRFVLRVTDTWTGTLREYANPLGITARTVADTNAFPMCP